jgi:hypothetical protein
MGYSVANLVYVYNALTKSINSNIYCSFVLGI